MLGKGLFFSFVLFFAFLSPNLGRLRSGDIEVGKLFVRLQENRKFHNRFKDDNLRGVAWPGGYSKPLWAD